MQYRLALTTATIISSVFLALSACKPTEQAKAEPSSKPATSANESSNAIKPTEVPQPVAASSAATTAASGVARAVAPQTAPNSADSAKLYTVVDGTKVDANTMEGFRTWRAAACDRCHGANQEGMVGPSLIDSLKTLSKEEFVKTLREGRLEKGMPNWSTNEQVMKNMDNLYAYLKGRSDGAITAARVYPI